MGKRGKSQKKGPQHSKKIKLHNEDVDFNNMDDEIDACNFYSFFIILLDASLINKGY